MTVRSRFNTEDNYTCEDVIEEQKILYSDNICIQEGFKVSQSDIASMSLKVKQGTAKIKGVSIVSDAQETVNISTNSSSYPRYDLVVLEVNNTTYVASLKVLQGTPASEPQVPDIASNQLALAKISIAAGATSILDSNIVDVRNAFNYNSLCSGINEVIRNTVKNNKEKTFITSKSSNIDVSNYSAEHNWYYVRNGFCTLSLDLLIKFWTGNTSGISDSYILSGLPKPISEVHYGLVNFDNKNRASLSAVVDADGSIRIINVHSYNGSTRFSGTITYPVALAD